MNTKILLFLFALLATFVLFGADVTNSLPVDGTATADLDDTIRKTFDKYSAMKLFIMPVVTLIVMLSRKYVGRIPDQAWPWLAPFIGVGADYLASKTGLWTGSAEAGAAMGGLAVWLHQWGSQSKEVWDDGFKTTKPDGSIKPPTP